jgi:hypothetical protein
LSKVTGAASRATILSDHGKHNPIAEVADFLKPELQLLVRAKPVLKEAANGSPSLEAVPQRPPVEGRIFGEAAGYSVEITAIRSLKRPAHKLDRVGGRGLLGHRPASIAQAARVRRARELVSKLSRLLHALNLPRALWRLDPEAVALVGGTDTSPIVRNGAAALVCQAPARASFAFGFFGLPLRDFCRSASLSHRD